MIGKRSWILVVLLVVAAFFLLGMGDLGLTGEKTPRAPSKNFTGTVTDRSNVTVEASHIHCDGKTSIKAYMGDMRLTLPFEKIKKVDFYSTSGGYTLGDVNFRNGEMKKLRFKSLTRCYGETDLGQLMVKVKDLKRIVFNSPPTEE